MSRRDGCEKCGTTDDIDRVGLLHCLDAVICRKCLRLFDGEPWVDDAGTAMEMNAMAQELIEPAVGSGKLLMADAVGHVHAYILRRRELKREFRAKVLAWLAEPVAHMGAGFAP